MAHREYVLLITFDGPPDPDDARPLQEQADEQVDGLVYWIEDALGGMAEVLSVHTCPGGVAQPGGPGVCGPQGVSPADG